VTRDVVCCAVGEEQYALRGAHVCQIARVEEMTRAPGADGRVGTLDVAGRPIPVFSLGQVLGQCGTPTAPLRGHIAVTCAANGTVGWLVDRLVRARSTELSLVPLPPVVGTVAATWFEALVRQDDALMLLVAPQHLGRGQASPAASIAAAPMPRAAAPTGGRAARLVAIFSTPALPHAEVFRFALSARQIVAVVQPFPSIAVPGSVRHVRGVGLWRDAAVTLIDFRAADAAAVAGSRTRWMVVQCSARLGGACVAFPIDTDITLHRAGADDRQVPGSCPAFASGLFDVGGETVALIDIDALLARAPARGDRPSP
jgi:chemotaxis signal transduction protein